MHYTNQSSSSFSISCRNVKIRMRHGQTFFVVKRGNERTAGVAESLSFKIQQRRPTPDAKN